MKTEIFKDYSAFLSREDKSANGVTQEFADGNPNWNQERGARKQGVLELLGLLALLGLLGP